MENRHLFRGKRIDNGVWACGYLYGIWEKRYILWGMFNDIPGMIEVDQATICQCTGLKDKNGKLIWENDILSGHIDVEFPEDETRKCVVWHENGWCTNEPGCDYYEELDDFDSENFEVIGNMIDNPELLEELKQYRAIGTVEECRAAMEKQTAKRPRIIVNAMICPSCPRCFKSDNSTYCPSCGQKLKWEDEE